RRWCAATNTERANTSLLCTAELLYFFFFQAEDGIRDGHVTGVQTCALPISQRDELERRLAGLRGNVELPIPAASAVKIGGERARSEERRVGKEGRSRGWPYQ